MTDGDEASAWQSVTESKPPASSSVRIDSVAYSTEGGKRADNHLVVTGAQIDQAGGPVVGATVRVDIYHYDAQAHEGSAVTGANGSVIFSLKNEASSSYSTTLRDISVGGLTWDDVNRHPGFCNPQGEEWSAGSVAN